MKPRGPNLRSGAADSSRRSRFTEMPSNAAKHFPEAEISNDTAGNSSLAGKRERAAEALEVKDLPSNMKECWDDLTLEDEGPEPKLEVNLDAGPHERPRVVLSCLTEKLRSLSLEPFLAT